MKVSRKDTTKYPGVDARMDRLCGLVVRVPGY
jgi:hypothetical protein